MEKLRGKGLLFSLLLPVVLLLVTFGVARTAGGTGHGEGLSSGARWRSQPSSVGMTERVSVASDGTQADQPSASPSISADGRYVAFHSRASSLVPGDTNTCNTYNCWDIFVHDRETGETTRVSVASDGAQGNDNAYFASISGDGRYVAFESPASNLVAGDTNEDVDVFVHDRETGGTSRVSVASDGAQGNDTSRSASISADGRYVAFESRASNLVTGDTNGNYDVFVHDRVTGETSRVSVASDGTQSDGWSENPSVSADGRFVAFGSRAGNLVAGDTNGHGDVFVHDRETGETERVSVATGGAQGDSSAFGPRISSDGRHVAFISAAGNLVTGDTNGNNDVFVHDRETGETERVSVASDGTEGNGDSGYGGGAIYAFAVDIAADGRIVAFGSHASNLVPDDTNSDGPFIFMDVFVHDRETGNTERVSVATDGTEANGGASYTSISGGGRYVAFDSRASNLVPDDTNAASDMFVRDREAVLALEASPASLSLELRPWMTVETGIVISNSGDVTVSWTLTEQPEVAWLNVTAGAGRLGAGESVSVSLSLDATGLALGEYQTALLLALLENGEDVALPVTLTVEAATVYLPITQRE